MPPIRITVEEFAEFLKQMSDDEEPSTPITPSVALLSRATTLAVQLNDPGLILGVLRTAHELELPITLEPECQTLLLKSMNSTN